MAERFTKYLTESQLTLLVHYRIRGASPNYISKKIGIPPEGVLNLESNLRDSIRRDLREQIPLEEIAKQLGYSTGPVSEFCMFYNLIPRPNEELNPPKKEVTPSLKSRPVHRRRRSSPASVLNPFALFRFK